MVLGIVMFAAGCSRKLSSSSTRISQDSTFVKVTERDRDTTVHVAGDTARLKTNIKNLNKPVTAKSGNASVSVQLVHDTLYAEARCEELELKLKLKDKETAIYRQLYDSLTSAQTFIKLQIPDTVKWFAIFGFLVIVLVIIYIIYLIKK